MLDNLASIEECSEPCIIPMSLFIACLKLPALRLSGKNVSLIGQTVAPAREETEQCLRIVCSVATIFAELVTQLFQTDL